MPVMCGIGLNEGIFSTEDKVFLNCRIKKSQLECWLLWKGVSFLGVMNFVELCISKRFYKIGIFSY